MDAILKLLGENARYSLEELSVLTGLTIDEVAEKLDNYENTGIILGYKAVIDWEKAGSEMVASVIEVKITPKYSHGFDEFAETVSKFPEVMSVYLMSGGYDILIEVLAKNFKELAMFVAKRLSPMESVLSTATHFILKRYKEKGVIYDNGHKDERGFII
ncbi:MAG: Lrp/AsnC family transcriptional regulator [Ruminococcaceae bacterium]|nr:Lrp/AsnC family transcriptional regulator [Oscillospiraceae bacterium]